MALRDLGLVILDFGFALFLFLVCFVWEKALAKQLWCNNLLNLYHNFVGKIVCNRLQLLVSTMAGNPACLVWGEKLCFLTKNLT